MGILELENLSKNFGGLKAVNNFNLTVEKGCIYGLIGPNGAGKSTVFNLVSGFIPTTSGNVIFNGQNIVGMKPNKIAKLGLIRTFQEPTIYKEFSVTENIEVAHYLHHEANDFGHFLNTEKAKKDNEVARSHTHKLIDSLGLTKFSDLLVENLPYGQLRLVQFALCSSGNPTLFLLDEPFTGMNLEEIDAFSKLVLLLRDNGATIIIIEHNMKVVMDLCEKITVLNFGEKIAEGTPNEIQSNALVIEAYLGSDTTF
ncbi:MAG: ABC transporter ATP-binding protein [Sphaerochaetaceae bacterium]